MSLTIRQKVLAVAGLMLAFALIQATVVFFQSSAMERNARHFSQQAMPMVQKIFQMKLAVVQVQQWLTDISATRGLDGLNDGFDEAQKQAERFRTLVQELRDLDPAREQAYATLLPAFEAYYRTGRKMAEAYVAQGPAGGNAIMSEFDTVAERLSNALDPMLDQITAETGVMLDEQEANSVKARYGMLGFSLGTIALVALMITGAFQQVLKPLCQVAEAIKDIAAGEGDLTRRLDAGRQDELGQLARGFNLFTEKLQAIVADIGSAVLSLTDKAEAMARTAEKTSQRIGVQHSETDQVATAMNEMSATVSEVAGHAANAAAAAEESDREATAGRQVVHQAIESISTLAEDVEKAAGVIQRLESTTENIGQVLDVIKGITEQTNLLALNAAIEAARAGEQGRGFAVVADEVRTLAARTQDSTTEIHGIIESLQSEARNAVQVMEEGRSQAQAVVERAGEAGDSLQSITAAVAKINDMNTLIASAAEEQTAVAEEINKNLVNISGVATETAEAASNTAADSQTIATLAEQLRGLVGRFKV